MKKASRGMFSQLAVILLLVVHLAHSAEANRVFELPNGQSLTEQLEAVRMVLSFQGKGTSLAYDAGVAKALSEEIPALQDQRNQVILTGHSSGGIPVIFFHCHGFDRASVAKAQGFLVDGNPAINKALKELRDTENPLRKAGLLLKGIIPAIPINNLDPYIAASLGVKDISHMNESVCPARVPFVLVAANQDILENREDPAKFPISYKHVKVGLSGMTLKKDSVFASRKDKEFNYEDFSVQWKRSWFRYYSTDEDGKKEFREKNPHLVLGQDQYIGQGCTYLADPVMAAVLEQIPAEERLCDIRKIETPEDKANAIRWTAAEPSYFGMMKEPDPDKVVSRTGQGDSSTNRVGNSVDRKYWGGFVMPLVAQDIRRVLPEVYVVGSGLTRLDMSQEGKVLTALSLVDSQKVADLSEYWADMVTTPSGEVQEKIRTRKFTHSQEALAGYERTKQCLQLERQGVEENRCLPPTIEVPALATAVEGAYTFTPEGEAMVIEGDLPRGRSIMPLLLDVQG